MSWENIKSFHLCCTFHETKIMIIGGSRVVVIVFHLVVFVCGDSRNEKFLNVFQIVKFANGPCNATSAIKGVCYTVNECTERGGSQMGTCASGFGACCTFVKGCGGTTRENNTYFSSSGFSSPCTIKACKIDDSICQIRLDFSKFVSSQPESSTTPTVTNCIDSRFSVGAHGETHTICGTNTGQHLYVEAEEGCNYFQMSIRYGTTSPTFNILISQIACSASFKAPDGCFQFFTGTTGTISSFNIDGGTHLADLKYTICIRAEEGYCTLDYSTTIFSLSSPTGTKTGTDCTEDYLVIPETGKNEGRVCGTKASVKTYQRPYRINVHFSSGDSSSSAGNDGFKLTYSQVTTNCV